MTPPMPHDLVVALRSHAIGQRTREMSDDLDPNAASPLEQVSPAELRLLRRMRARAKQARAIADRQARDPALNREPMSHAEGLMQMELRRLRQAVEEMGDV